MGNKLDGALGLNSMFSGESNNQNEEEKQIKTEKKISSRKKETPKKAKKVLRRVLADIDAEIYDKTKAIAYWDRTTLRKIVEKSLGNYIKNYERKNGPVKSVPEDD